MTGYTTEMYAKSLNRTFGVIHYRGQDGSMADVNLSRNKGIADA